MSSRENTRRIREESRRLGFELVGIADAVLLPEERGRLREWLRRGFHAGMEWMADDPDRRTDPEKILRGARSVVSVAMNYYRPGDQPEDPSYGKVSRYAWGDDYHDIIRPKLRALETFIATLIPGSLSKSYVDTGPVSDKAWAYRSGLGWLGKNTNILTRSHGSWVFLGTVFTTAFLEPDAPESDMCGSCTACIDACPTQALVEPYVLDAGKCISYLTIEHRGALPEELEHRLHGWVFGCDICQDVCPWNRFQHPSVEPRFEPRATSRSPRLVELESMDQTGFSRRFKGSPIKRAKVSGLRRNAKAVRESSAQ